MVYSLIRQQTDVGNSGRICKWKNIRLVGDVLFREKEMFMLFERGQRFAGVIFRWN
jgi:hypothetical protein